MSNNKFYFNYRLLRRNPKQQLQKNSIKREGTLSRTRLDTHLMMDRWT